MAALVGSLVTSLTVDLSPYAAGMAKAEAVTRQASDRIRKSVEDTANRTTSSYRTAAQAIAAVQGPLGGIASRIAALGVALRAPNTAIGILATSIAGIGFGSVAFVRVADRARLLSNQLKTVTSNSAEFADVQNKIFQVSQNTRSSLASTTTIYARTARAVDHLGLSQEKLLRITETVQKAFAVGGATVAEAQGAAIQLSQGIASNRFSGEEFRSVAENAPVLLRGMADSLGVNIGKLREMAHAGELTAEVVTKAILDSSAKIDSAFAKTAPTVEQAWLRVGNAVLKYASEVDNSWGITRKMVGGVISLADNFDTLASSVSAVVAGLIALGAGSVIGRVVSSLSRIPQALTAAAKEQRDALAGKQADVASQISKIRGQIGNTGAELEAQRQAKIAQAVGVRSKIEESLNGILSKRSEIEAKISAAKADHIKKLQDEVALAKKEVDSRAQAVSSVKQKAVSVSTLAESKALSKQIVDEAKAFETAREAAKKLKIEHGELLRAKQNALNSIRAVTADTPEVKKLTAEIVASQNAIAAAKARNKQIDKELNKPGITANREKALNKESLDHVGTMIREQKKLEENTKRLGQARVDAEKWASQQILAERRNYASIVAQIEENETKRAIATANVREARLKQAMTAPKAGGATGISAAETRAVAAYDKAVTNLQTKIHALAQAQAGAFDPQITKRLEGQLASLDKQVSKTQENLKAANSAIARAANGDQNAIRAAMAQRQASIAQLQTLKQQYVDLGTQITTLGRQSTVSGAFLTRLSAAGSSLLGFLGGWWGVAFTAAIAILGIWQYQTQKAAAETESFESTLRELGLLADETGGKVFDSTNKSSAAVQNLLNKSKAQIELYKQQVKDLDLDVTRTNEQDPTAGPEGAVVRRVDTEATKQFRDLQKAVIDGKISMQELVTQTGALVALNPQLAGLAVELEKLAGRLEAAGQLPKKLAETSKNLLFTDTKPFDDLINKYHEDRYEFQKATEQKIAIAKAEAKGNEARAKALQDYYDHIKNGGTLELQDFENRQKKLDALKKEAEAYEKAQKARERLNEKLARLREESQGTFLGDIDRSVLQDARELKFPAKDIEAYVNAAKNADFSKISEHLRELREGEVLKAAGQQYRDIVKTYGDWAQIAPLAAEKQAILNMAVQKGAIDAYQAQVAFADFLSEFGNYRWINSVSDAFGNFAVEVLSDFKNIDQALENLKKTILRIAHEVLVAEPVKQFMKVALTMGLNSFMGSGTGAPPVPVVGAYGTHAVPTFGVPSAKGNVFGPSGKITAFARGGVVKSPTVFPFATGIGLMGEAGPEAIMPLTRGPGGKLGVHAVGGGGGSNIRVEIINQSGQNLAARDGGRRTEGDVDVIRLIVDAVAGEIGSGKSPINQAMEGRYGLDRTRGVA